MDKRIVEVTLKSQDRVDGKMVWVENKRQAIFHAFGTDYEEYDDGPGHYPVAIVEYRDGVVDIVYAKCIRFLDRN